MKKVLFLSIIISIVFLIMALFSSNQALAQITVCDSGNNLSYDQAKDALASGELFVTHSVDLPGNQIAITVDNNTPCSLPTSLASYKMFGPYSLDTQSEQEFFDGTQLYTIAPNSTEVLRVNLPGCASQYDLWYGPAPTVLVNNQPYGSMLVGDQVRQDSFCVLVLPPVSPIITVIKQVINDNNNNDIPPVVVSGGSSIGSSMLSIGAVYVTDVLPPPPQLPPPPSVVPTGQVLGVQYVAIPDFPRTGFGPLTKIIPLNVFLALFVMVLAGVAFITDRFRKRTSQYEHI